MKTNNILIISILLLFSCARPEARKPILRKTSSFLKESIERNKVINKLEENAFLQLMENDSTNEYVSSASGFWYHYNIKDTVSTKFPIVGDEVIYTYEIKDINGSILYAEEDLGERNYLVDKQELITGLQDGLKLMKEGEKVTFLFPSYKAYGYSGYQKIGSNQPLIYTVTLKKIMNK